MNCKSEINKLQKRLLERLKVKTGSTMFTIIEAITRQAYAKDSFVVSQKNSTLAGKCKVTASTISRNLKKIKEKCADLITIEQNRNVEERFAALVFTFVPQECQTVMSNGEQTEQVKDTNEPNEVAEITSSFSSTESLVYISNSNKNLKHIVKHDVDKDQIIYDTYIEFKEQGIDKSLFNRVLSQVQKNKGIRNFGAYLRGALNKVIGYKEANNSTEFVDESRIKVDTSNIPFYYDWIDG
ncbi:hypothetical protein SOP94_19670 [Peribacillus frigoritolerans]|uniref:hypothetical protein n=1 Tax=Peribacillus frigoritolerans TaxID=450367 RepID=UPI002B240902|nr:hypothetical protein [Peribacillus frigoritolerans]MEB2630678.1 hypothetical protein [Peribacillus frigoritolerans]